MTRTTSEAELTKEIHSRLPLPPALHYRNYLWYWIGLVASVLGFRAFEFAQFWLIHELTGSPIYLGILGLANGLPAVVLNLVGGVVADRFNRRRLVIVTQLGIGIPVIALGILTATGQVEPIHIIIVAAIVSGMNSFNTPARLALFPQYVKRDALLSAVALNSAAWQGSRIIAPAAAGVLIAAFGTAPAFYFAGVGTIALGVIMYFLPDSSRTNVDNNAMQDLKEGMRFIRRTSPFAFLIGITFIGSFFGLSYVTLMPVFAVDVLDVGAGGQGILLAVAGIGALGVTIVFGTRRSFKGIVIAVGALGTAISLIVFAVTAAVFESMPIALVSIFFVGAFMAAFTMSVNTTLQLLVPDKLRGRVMGFWSMTWNIMPLGAIFLGVIAEGYGAPIAVATGGLLVLFLAALPAVRHPHLRRLGKDDAMAT